MIFTIFTKVLQEMNRLFEFTGNCTRWVFVLIMIMGGPVAHGIGPDEPAVDSCGSSEGFFSVSEILDLTLEFDFEGVFGDHDEDPEYRNVVVSYRNGSGETVSLQAGIRTRGSFRLDPVNCDFPPLKLKFVKDHREGTVFSDVRELKMVTHCRTDESDFEQYELQEYLIYRIFNVLSDISFRVRLIRVHYVDSGTAGSDIEKYAFFIEDKGDLEDRLEGKILDVSIAEPAGVDQDQFSLVSFFEYMIVNSDWSLPIVHNVVIFSTNYFNPPYPIPYDFDWAGIISVPYHVPGIGIRSEGEFIREYKGACRSRKDFTRIIDTFNNKRLEIYNLYIGFDPLEDKFKEETFRDLNEFYDIINDPRKFRKNIKSECRDYLP